MSQIYFIGGSPCSGKSTAAEALTNKYGFHYFKVDDYLDDYTANAAARGAPICSTLSRLTQDEIWMRSPALQNEEELEFYHEIFDLVMSDIEKLRNGETDIVAEGAAFLPELMKALGIDARHYIAVIPTKDFQLSRYRARPLISQVLEGCTDKDAAFYNWMERDALFASSVKARCIAEGYSFTVTDDHSTKEETLKIIENNFNLIL